MEILKLYNYDVIFIGDDCKGNARWVTTEEELNLLGKTLIYLPHTNEISTTQIREKLEGKDKKWKIK